MIAPMTIEALVDLARALGFDLVARGAVPVGIDADRATEQPQYALFRSRARAVGVEFDGTARECAAFLIGWRDLRARVLGELGATDAKIGPELTGAARCAEYDASGDRRCLHRSGHEGSHATLVPWHGSHRRTP